MPTESISAERWIQRHLDRHGVAIRGRRLRLHCEFDAGFHLDPEAALDAALDRLIRFVLATVPDECEVYLAASRALAPVSALGDGSLTLRWQVTGSTHPVSSQEGVQPIHPIAGEAASHATSSRVAAIHEAFRAAGWSVEFGPLQPGAELFVRVDRMPGSGAASPMP